MVIGLLLRKNGPLVNHETLKSFNSNVRVELGGMGPLF
jgi:hypothetical protein